MKNYFAKLTLLVIILLPLMPTKSSEVNHKIKRYNNAQANELIITLKHLQSPMPSEKKR